MRVGLSLPLLHLSLSASVPDFSCAILIRNACRGLGLNSMVCWWWRRRIAAAGIIPILHRIENCNDRTIRRMIRADVVFFLFFFFCSACECVRALANEEKCQIIEKDTQILHGVYTVAATMATVAQRRRHRCRCFFFFSFILLRLFLPFHI